MPAVKRLVNQYTDIYDPSTFNKLAHAGASRRNVTPMHVVFLMFQSAASDGNLWYFGSDLDWQCYLYLAWDLRNMITHLCPSIDPSDTTSRGCLGDKIGRRSVGTKYALLRSCPSNDRFNILLFMNTLVKFAKKAGEKYQNFNPFNGLWKSPLNGLI
ncbi:hypothetical protein B0H19DRAFT_1083154 [Mycena capillaripes]|nr:hypothetical protein B0H19DRAFT_1083154 [Mycena capillaripes]